MEPDIIIETAPYIVFEHVYKRYKMGEVTIIAANGVSFEINKGEFAVIVGASGAGKTTVLNMLGRYRQTATRRYRRGREVRQQVIESI
jgi:ABC-type lipoprotein export system ATPase subunit